MSEPAAFLSRPPGKHDAQLRIDSQEHGLVVPLLVRQ